MTKDRLIEMFPRMDEKTAEVAVGLFDDEFFERVEIGNFELPHEVLLREMVEDGLCIRNLKTG